MHEHTSVCAHVDKCSQKGREFLSCISIQRTREMHTPCIGIHPRPSPVHRSGSWWWTCLPYSCCSPASRRLVCGRGPSGFWEGGGENILLLAQPPQNTTLWTLIIWVGVRRNFVEKVTGPRKGKGLNSKKGVLNSKQSIFTYISCTTQANTG